MRGPAAPRRRQGERYRRRERVNGEHGFNWPRANVVDLDNMARDAFTRIDEIYNVVVNEGDEAPMDAHNVEVDEQYNEVNFENLVQESTQNVFEGNNQNRLQCSIVLFTLCSLYSVPNTFLDALLT